MTTLVLIAKEPLPGRAKTRLHPAVSLQHAALIAGAAIDDTLRTLNTVPATRRVLFFDGEALPARAAGWDVIRQPAGTLDERLAHIFDELSGPVLLVGMDTPQLSAADLAPAFTATGDTHDAWFGPAVDGGFWALGMREPRGELIRGIRMSQHDTGHHQLMRLAAASLDVGMLRPLADVDTIETAFDVAALIPDSLFSRTLCAVPVHQVAA